MLQQERHNQILAKLNLEGQVIVKELSQAFNVTEDCIRKDLTALEKAGLLKRIHGGAIQVRENLHTINVNERLKIHSPEKRIIAKKAVEQKPAKSKVYLLHSDVLKKSPLNPDPDAQILIGRTLYQLHARCCCPPH